MGSHVQTALALSGCFALAVGVSALANAQDGAPDSQVPARFGAELGAGAYDDQEGKVVAIVEASDPRISGTWTESTGISTSVRMEGGAGDVISIWLHDITIDNAAGSWMGHSEGFGHSEDFRGDISPDGETIYLVGHEAYEGLTATLFSPKGQDRDPSTMEGGVYEGVIFPTGWQPVAEPIS
jgi:hypothetical protein